MVEGEPRTVIPSLVQRAINLAEQLGYTGSPSVETGRLLQLLASQYQSGVIGELATGCGVATAWIVSALSPATSFFTVDSDEARSAAVRAMFDRSLNVRVMHGDWRDLMESWRFNMLFAGYNSQRSTVPKVLLDSLREGGLILFDGLPPQERMTLSEQNDAKQVRDYWHNQPKVYALEVGVSASETVLLATRYR